MRAVRVLAGAHFAEQPQVFLRRAVAVPAVSARLGQRAAVLADLVCAQRVDVCEPVLDELFGELEQVIERWDRSRNQNSYQPEPRTGIVESIFRAFTALDEIDRLAQFVGYILATPKRYDLHTVLIPAVNSLHATLAPDSPGRTSFERLLHHCTAELHTRTAAPIEPPDDWSRDAKIDCKCADCKELAQFLRDPAEQLHRFPRRKELRQHLHQQIDKHRLDLTHVTERKGSPQTLVCTKSQATYERRLAQFNVDVQLLKELQSVAGPETTRLPATSTKRPAKSKKRSSRQTTDIGRDSKDL